MTREEAIKALGLFRIFDAPGLEEAVDMAVDALRDKQGSKVVDFDHFKPVKLDRRRWEGCEHCKGDLEGYTSCFRNTNGSSIKMYIPEGEAAIVIPGRYNHRAYIKISYCPFCGRPLTEEAWAELDRRINHES